MNGAMSPARARFEGRPKGLVCGERILTGW
jgi:hypothetical protein